MLESLYEEAINKKGTIQEQIVEYQHKDLDLSKNWIETHPYAWKRWRLDDHRSYHSNFVLTNSGWFSFPTSLAASGSWLSDTEDRIRMEISHTGIQSRGYKCRNTIDNTSYSGRETRILYGRFVWTGSHTSYFRLVFKDLRRTNTGIVPNYYGKSASALYPANRMAVSMNGINSVNVNA